jgi:hypothetical protein
MTTTADTSALTAAAAVTGARSVPVAEAGPSTGPIGRQRDIATQVLLSIVTLGVYGVYWAYTSHEDIRRRTGDGIGGVLGAVVYLFAAFVTWFLLPVEIQRMYERDGRESPVRASTAAWILLFGIPWYVKCQRALNRYWAAQGAPAA